MLTVEPFSMAYTGVKRQSGKPSVRPAWPWYGGRNINWDLVYMLLQNLEVRHHSSFGYLHCNTLVVRCSDCHFLKLLHIHWYLKCKKIHFYYLLGKHKIISALSESLSLSLCVCVCVGGGGARARFEQPTVAIAKKTSTQKF
jgi:hypothetical protein